MHMLQMQRSKSQALGFSALTKCWRCGSQARACCTHRLPSTQMRLLWKASAGKRINAHVACALWQGPSKGHATLAVQARMLCMAAD